MWLGHFKMSQLTAAIAVFLISTAFSQGLVNVVDLPGDSYFNSAFGLSTDSSSLFISSSSSTSPQAGYVTELDTAGNVLNSFPTGLGTSQGLAWTGSTFWYFKRSGSSSAFVELDPSGNQLRSISSGTAYIAGLYWDGDGLWYGLYYPDADAGFYKLDVNTGTVVDTILVPHRQPHGITSDGQYFYLVGDDFSGDPAIIFIYDPAVQDTVGAIQLSDPFSQNPRGITWDGQYLWLLGDPVGPTARALFQFDLGGSGAPNIELPVTQVNFGQVSVGSTDSALFNIQNIGSAALSISAITFSDPVFSSNLSSFPLEIPANGSYLLTLYFTPLQQGLVSGVMSIFSNDPADPQVDIALEGEGLNVSPTIELTATSHDFGTIWVPAEGLTFWTLGIINTGISNLEVSAMTLSDPVFSYDAPALPFNVAPGDTAEVMIWFNPENPQTYFDTLRIASNDPNQPVAEVALQGTGQAGPFNLGYLYWHYQVPDNPATSFNEYRPLALKTIKDLTGDGVDDVILSSRNYWTIALNGASAGAAAELWRFSTYISNSSAGAIGNTNDLPPQQRAMAIASDLNSDGVDDVVIGTGGGNEHVYALSGLDGSIIWQFGTDHPDSFGLGDITSVYVEEDFNGDQVNDVIATGSATNQGVAGRRTVYCFDGTNGQIIWQYFLGSFLRMAVTLGDVNNNGSPDVVVGTGDGVSNTYSFVALDPNGPTILWSFPVPSSDGGGRELLRYEVPGETADVIAGAYFDQIWRLDGQTGQQVWNFNAALSGVNELNVIEDVDGDGFDDILVASFSSNFYCISGADGNIIWTHFFGNFSWSARSIPDLTGDGHADVIVACRDDNLYLLNGMDGTTVLQYPMNSGMLQGATIVYPMQDLDNNGGWEILGADDSGKIVALSGGDSTLTAINDGEGNRPEHFFLSRNYPNPFNPSTMLEFGIGHADWVTLKVYDLLGREVKTLVNGHLEAGSHRVQWDGKDNIGNPVASGIYLYRLEAGNFHQTRKMLLVR